MSATKTVNIASNIRSIYSKEIIRNAQPLLRFAQFAKKREDLTKQTGGAIKFTRYSSIKKGGRLTEGVNINEKSMSSSEV